MATNHLDHEDCTCVKMDIIFIIATKVPSFDMTFLRLRCNSLMIL